MKTLLKTYKHTLLFVFLALFLSACEGDWGIDKDISIPKCNNADIRDNSAAVKVAKNTVIKPLEAGTKVRIWHYVNTEKYACTISGNAYIVQ